MAADIYVVFASQSGHRPMQRGFSYGIDAAYPDSLQPALLRVYQWVSRRWHEFLETHEGPSRNVILNTPASQLNGGTKRRISDGSEGKEIKRFRISDVRQDISVERTPGRGLLASALQSRAQNRYDETKHPGADEHHSGLLDPEPLSSNAFQKRRGIAEFFEEQGRLSRKEVSRPFELSD